MTYHMVESSLWSDDKFARTPYNVKLVLFHLLTGPLTNLTGCFPAETLSIVGSVFGHEIKKNPADIGRYMTMVMDALSYLEKEGIIKRCEETGWTWLVNHLKHRPIPNPKAGSAAMKIIRTVPKTVPFYQELMASYRIHAIESRGRVTSKDEVLDLRQIDALIQSHKKRYRIDTTSAEQSANEGGGKEHKIDVKTRLETDNKNNDLGDDTKSDTVPVPVPVPVLESDTNSESNQGNNLSHTNLCPPDGGQGAPKKKYDFEEWWLCWSPGTKRSKDKAEPKYRAVIRTGKATHEQLCQGVIDYMAWCRARATPTDKIKHPPTWLHGGCWKDELVIDGQRTSENGKPDGALNAALNVLERRRGLGRRNHDDDRQIVAFDKAHSGPGVAEGGNLRTLVGSSDRVPDRDDQESLELFDQIRGVVAGNRNF